VVRVRALSEEQHRALLRVCADHPVALCETCAQAHRVADMAMDPFTRRHYLCPLCAADLFDGVVDHVRTCPALGGGA